jgi:FkbM family methyltransferase
MLLKAERGNPDQVPVAATFKNLIHPIAIRPGTDDVRTVIDNIVREEWGNFDPGREPVLMIDGGAYIGDSSAYFLSRFPALKVLALEPDPITFERLITNLQPYGARVKMLNCGLYSRTGEVRLGSKQTGSAIKESGETEIAVITLESLLRTERIAHVDILKLDIEGAEEAIFTSDPQTWLSQIDWLLIEFHSEGGQSAICSVLKKQGFKMRQFRSVWYCRRPEGNGDRLQNRATAA